MLNYVRPEPRRLFEARGVSDLTPGQQIALLEIHAGKAAIKLVTTRRAQLDPRERHTPIEDRCALAMLALVAEDAERGLRLTERGRRWLYPLIGA